MPSEYQLHGRTKYNWSDTNALQNLRLNKDVPKPSNIPSGHALVRIRAAALNARDMMVVAHAYEAYPGPHKEDLVPCADGAGEIDTVGEGSKWKAGDRVIINANAWTTEWKYGSDIEMPDFHELGGKGALDEQGTLREYAILPDDQLIPAPDYLPYEELAAIPGAGSSAMHALFFGPQALKPGQTILTQGTGGVSCFAIQLAAAVGATVIATSSSDAKLEQARSFGATHTINYCTHPNWEDEVLHLTSGRGVDIVVEVAGASTILQSIKCTRLGGMVALVGFLAGGKEQDIVAPIIVGGKTVYGVYMHVKWMNEKLLQFMDEKKIRPIVAEVFEWEDAKKAFETMAKQIAVGKIVVKVGK
ncbi:NAD(P)-binding protein [Lojkania enalia]|uniref:NAD(P)-binding protein n=1 Tax=Lojkania enalia TaxID=147567 RepID=A0A9P4KAC9_9PLEO|nr:NAD(P)-binding protein [Didymosphaeria enalia]